MIKRYRWILLIIEILLLGWMVWQYQDKFKQIISPVVQKDSNIKPEIEEVAVDQKEITPIIEPTKTITPTIVKKTIITPTPDNEPWGVAKQINEVTWTMKVGDDEKMATTKEIFEALNEYRKRYNSQPLTWDNKLGDYAQSRSKYLNGIKNVDKHEGFNTFVEKEDGFNKLGFNALGENISYGYRLNGVHVIEWMYAGDKPHNDNQLDNRWNYVGIGVDGLATCLIFGTGKF
jgi:uncharacterized protein YkwD